MGQNKWAGPQVVLATPSGCRVPEEASALAEGAPLCLCGPHKCPAFFLGVLLFLQAQVVPFLERAAQGQRWVCAAPQPLRFRPPWPPHLPSVGASLLSLGPGCSFPPPIDLWVFVQFSTCLRQVKLESCSSSWARSHCLTAFLTSPRVLLELASPSSPLSASHVSRGPGGQHLSPLLPGDNIFLVL